MTRLAAFLIAATVWVGIASPALAVPQVLQYQGRLTDPAGQPLNGPANVAFSIYTEAESGTPLWTQSFESLALDNGRFSLILGGDEAPFTPELIDELRNGTDLYLGIQVDDDPEMTPRQQIASVVYALHAAYAESTLTVSGMPGLAYRSVIRNRVAPGTSESVATVSITTLLPGYILVSGSGTLILDNSSGQGAASDANIGEVLDAAPETIMGFVSAQVDPADVRARHYVPFHCQRVYQKDAGQHTFRLNVQNRSGGFDVLADWPSLTAVFIPNLLGTAQDSQPQGAPPASATGR